MIKIYHNPRCRKSREGLEVLQNLTSDFEIIKYMDEPLTYLQILELLKKLDLKPIELVRTNEKIWKEEFKDQDLTDEQIVQAMENYPRLIERPIVVKDDKAVIGRPSDSIPGLIKA
ncbi:arsenate reductase [Flavobacteriaceae bacterium MAR_2010_188]|nr:arsenate reductase [Flavobacteriaceae bacterium MAR_2010_188]